MEARSIIFPCDLGEFLRLTADSISILREFDMLPDAKRVPGTCLYFYFKDEIEEIARKMADDGDYQARVNYLLTINRYD
jgi:hypothetical protein